MIEHVYRRTALAAGIAEVVVATCDEEIRDTTERFGGRVVMTSAKHERASDRVAEAAEQLDADVYLMVQGDEPMVTPGMLEAALGPVLRSEDVGCVNLIKRIDAEDEFRDPDTVKVVFDGQRRALYFSREPVPAVHVVPWDRTVAYKQVCVIPFRREALREYARLEPRHLERAESVDMLRFLEHGLPVRLVETDVETHAVDRPEDVRRAEDLLRRDPLTRRYLRLDV